MLTMFRIAVVLALYLTGNYCNASDLQLNGSSIVSMLERKPRLNIVSFQPVGEHVALGLDFLLPFIKVPLLREVDVDGSEPALININTAALVSTGILAGSSALVSYLIKSYVVFKPTQDAKKTRRSDMNFENELWSMLNNFKVIYKNSSGIKVDTSLTGFLTTIDETLHQKGIDLSSCLQKALCQGRQQSAAYRTDESDISGLDKILDGLTSLKWFRNNVLRYTSLNDVIDNDDNEAFSNRQPKRILCDEKYPRCKWSKPAKNMASLFGSYLKFT